MNDISDIRKFQGFEKLNLEEDSYQNVITGIYREMMLRKKDRDIETLKKYPIFIKIFLWKNKVESGGKYDHKPIIKKFVPSFFSKKADDEGKYVTIRGTYIPGDKEYNL